VPTRRQLLRANLVAGALVALGLVAYAHAVHRPRPLVLTGASLYWAVRLEVRAGTRPGQALLDLATTYEGTGTARGVTWNLADASGRVLLHGTLAGPLARGATLGRTLALLDAPPPNWAGVHLDIAWTEVTAANPAGQGTAETVPLGPGGAT
jgi:hypothetical protein